MMELQNHEIKYKQSFEWPEEGIDDERASLIKHVGDEGLNDDLEQNLMGRTTPPSTRMSGRSFQEDGRTIAKSQPAQHERNKTILEMLGTGCCCARSKDLNKRENMLYLKFKSDMVVQYD